MTFSSKVFSSKFLKHAPLNQWLAVIILLTLLLIAAIPGYISGNWEWKKSAPIVNIKQIRELPKHSLDVAGWKTLKQEEINIGGHKWSRQVIEKQQKESKSDSPSSLDNESKIEISNIPQSTNIKVTLLLHPQNGDKSKPQVEWTDIDSLTKWKIAQYRSASFQVSQENGNQNNTKKASATSDGNAEVKARFFRANKSSNTYAVLQWYAMPSSGSPSPVNWFLADQVAKLHQERVPWIAVNIMMPIEPLGQVEDYWSQMKSLGETVQKSLMVNIFGSQ